MLQFLCMTLFSNRNEIKDKPNKQANQETGNTSNQQRNPPIPFINYTLLFL